MLYQIRFLAANFPGRCVFDDFTASVKDVRKKSHHEMKMATGQ